MLEVPSTREGASPCRYPPKRYFVIFMLFLGMANSYIMRTNMSVAIVAMVNHTAIDNAANTTTDCLQLKDEQLHQQQDGHFVWNTKQQGLILSSFYYGYIATQIPLGFLSKTYGALRFLGWGMLINSILAFFVPIAAQKGGAVGLGTVRVLQGFFEGPIVPCSHALIAKWTPPNERSRMCTAVYAGAQFGTIFSLPISGVLAERGFAGGWPSIFYIFGSISLLWSIFFLIWVKEDPQSDSRISEIERKFILESIWGSEGGAQKGSIPFRKIFTSFPFYAILVAHMGHNYGYETLITELSTYFKQILHFSLRENGIYSALPFVAMWCFSTTISFVADWLITTKRLTTTATRRVMNTIGQCGPGIALIMISFAGCNRVLAVSILTVGVGLNGAIFSGFKANHLDLSPRFAGFTMSITNCLANVVGITAPSIAGYILYQNHTLARWRRVFFISASIYITCSMIYNIFSSGKKQDWDNISEEEPKP